MQVSVMVKNTDLPVIKKAATDLGVDVIKGEVGKEFSELHLLIGDYGVLIYIGLVAGIDTAFTGIRNPLTQMIGNLERKLDNFNNSKEK